MSTPRLYIAVPIHNRGIIGAMCIPTIYSTKLSCDFLEIWNDASTEFSDRFLWNMSDRISTTDEQQGIEAQRKRHFEKFLEPEQGAYTHLYLTDSDAIHDPNWRSHALGLQREHRGLPVCLYDTEAHRRLQGNTLEDDITKNAIIRAAIPGVSMLLTRAHVERIGRVLESMDHWDWFVPSVLGNRCIVSRVSHVDHIGLGGLHHPADEGLDGGDRAHNPTAWLVEKRKEIVAALSE